MERTLVTGAGGFIGHHLVARLKQEGHWVRGVDIKLPEFGASDADEFEILDLRRWDACLEATRGIDQVYALAADMGGMGFISSNHSRILHNNALINLHTMHAAVLNGACRYFYSSSACVYPEYLQLEENVVPLKEEDAFPAAPQDAYGWEKLFTELLCGYYASDYGIDTRVLRFHNIYGPLGTYEGGREKAPAALCRKAALAEDGGQIEIWGDGAATPTTPSCWQRSAGSRGPTFRTDCRAPTSGSRRESRDDDCHPPSRRDCRARRTGRIVDHAPSGHPRGGGQRYRHADCARANRPVDIQRRAPVCVRDGRPRDHGVTARPATP